MDDDEIEGWREMTLDEKKRLREILGYGLSAALPIAADDRDVELARLRAAMAEAERERDEARADRNTWALREGSTKALMARKYAATDRQRRTIRALVVAARAIHRTMWSALDCYDVNNEGIEREMRQHVIGLRWEMQQAERKPDNAS